MQTARLYALLETAMTLAPVSLWIWIFVLQRGMLASIGLDFCRILVSWITGN